MCKEDLAEISLFEGFIKNLVLKKFFLKFPALVVNWYLR
jgi:hypothetical protein